MNHPSTFTRCPRVTDVGQSSQQSDAFLEKIVPHQVCPQLRFVTIPS